VGIGLASGVVVAGRYKVERARGEGTRKQTYLAWDTLLPRPVVLAIFKESPTPLPGEAADPEALILGQIGGHDNIVTLYDRGSDGEFRYLIFEYLPNGTLRAFCEKIWAEKQQVEIADALRWFRQLSRALSHIHSRDILHRDVSPRHVWLDERNVAHLGDFDSAINLGATETLKPAAIAIEAYSSPEQARGDLVDVRSDLYSLGALLYEVSCGQRPKLSPWTESSPPPPSHYRPDLPSQLDALILSLVSYAPKDRPGSADLIIERLQDITKTADLETLISAGESDLVEFKSTFRWDLHEQRPNNDRINDITKCIAAMLNMHGRTLLIGVADDQTPVGLDFDLLSFDEDCQTLDEFERKLRSAISSQIGVLANQNVGVSFPHYQGTPICRVDIRAAGVPAFLKRKAANTEFYIRAGNASQPLTDLQEFYHFVKYRWDVK